MKKGTSLYEVQGTRREEKLTCQGARHSGATLLSHMWQWGRPSLRLLCGGGAR